MRGTPLAAFLALVALVIFAFMVFQGGEGAASGARHWATAPLTAFAIVFSGGALVALSSGRNGSFN